MEALDHSHTILPSLLRPYLIGVMIARSRIYCNKICILNRYVMGAREHRFVWRRQNLVDGHVARYRLLGRYL